MKKEKSKKDPWPIRKEKFTETNWFLACRAILGRETSRQVLRELRLGGVDEIYFTKGTLVQTIPNLFPKLKKAENPAISLRVGSIGRKLDPSFNYNENKTYKTNKNKLSKLYREYAFQIESSVELSIESRSFV